MGQRAKNPDTERVVTYVRERLRKIVRDSDKPYGKPAELARDLRCSAAHMSNVLNGKAGIGEAMRRAALPLLGFATPDELEAAALGRPLPTPPGELDYQNPQHFALVVRSVARDMGIGKRVADALIARAETQGVPPAERLGTELRILEGILAANRVADDEEIDRLR